MLAEQTNRQSERDRIERELFLRAMLGRDVPSARELAQQLRAFTLEAGAYLYRAGDVANEAYFVVRGSIGLARPGGPEREFGPGSMIGMFDIEHDRPRVRSARALTPVELLALSAEDRLELLEDSFEHTRAVIRRMASRLDEIGRYDGQSLVDPAHTLAPKDEPLPLIERVFTLRDTPAFRRATIQALVSLAPAADELRLTAGEQLFVAGEARGVLFVVVAGCVELSTGADGQHERYASATLLGGGAALGGALARQSARALTPAVVLRLREEDLYDVMEDHFELARSIMRYLATEHEEALEALEAAAAGPAAPAKA